MSFIIHELLSGYLQTLFSLWLPIKSVVLKNIQTPGGNFTEDPHRYRSLIMPGRKGRGGGCVSSHRSSRPWFWRTTARREGTSWTSKSRGRPPPPRSRAGPEQPQRKRSGPPFSDPAQDLVLPKAEVLMDKLDVTVDNASGPKLS